MPHTPARKHSWWNRGNADTFTGKWGSQSLNFSFLFLGFLLFFFCFVFFAYHSHWFFWFHLGVLMGLNGLEISNEEESQAAHQRFIQQSSWPAGGGIVLSLPAFLCPSIPSPLPSFLLLHTAAFLMQFSTGSAPRREYQRDGCAAC